MYSSFFNLFLGLLFQLDFYALKGIDILPDVIGYYFFYKGLKVLAKENKYFEIAAKLVLPLFVLSIVKLYNFQYHQELLVSFSFALDIIKIILFALNLYFVYNIGKGAIEVAGSIQDTYLERTIGQRLYLYLGISGFLLFLSIISLLPFGGIVAALQSIFTVILFAYIFVLIIMAAGIFNLYKQLSPAKVKPVKAKAAGKVNMKASGKSGQSKRKR